jgi:hypothetical protein
MGRRKKTHFKLDPEWLLKEPVDFEYNKYTLLDYLQKCEKRLENLEIYPDFVELSLHLTNLQSLAKEKTLLLTNKKFQSLDDEILLKELYPKKPRELSEDEILELDKTITYSGNKLYDIFNIAKSIWNLAFDSIEVIAKKNKNNLFKGRGYIFYYKKDEDKILIWEYDIKKVRGEGFTTKTTLSLIYYNQPSEDSMASILKTYSKWNDNDDHTKFPIFEVKSTQNFPMESTMIPLIKRKLLTYIFQSKNSENLKKFDF